MEREGEPDCDFYRGGGPPDGGAAHPDSAVEALEEADAACYGATPEQYIEAHERRFGAGPVAAQAAAFRAFWRGSLGVTHFAGRPRFFCPPAR